MPKQRRCDMKERKNRVKQAESEIPIVRYKSLSQDFSGIEREAFEIGSNSPYRRRNPFWKIASFLAYRIVMTPFAYLYSKIKFGLRIENRKAFRQTRGKGVFVYGNHTLMAGDAFFPSLVAFPKKTMVVVKSDNLAGSATRWWIELCGSIPIPTKHSGMRGFLDAIEKSILLGHSVTVYPEAHIWPYYTGIRPFGCESFRYPVKFDAPVYCTTVTYQKPRHGRTPRVTVYVDGPFYQDPTLSDRENAQRLRDLVYKTMCERAKNSTYEAIHYLPAVESEPTEQA